LRPLGVNETEIVPLGEGLDSMVKGFCEHDGDVIAVGKMVMLPLPGILSIPAPQF